MSRSIAVQPYAQRVIPPRPGRLFLRARDRRGAAVLIIAMIFLFVLGVMQLGQSFLATQVTDQTAQAIYGNAAQTLADSVIEEVFNWVDTQANQPAKPLFSQVRQELPQAANAFASSGILPASVEIDISEEAYPSARALRALPTLDHYVIEGVSGNLTYDRRLGAFFDQAYSGILTLRAVVSTKLEPAVRRTVERRIGFRVLNLAIPPPLGQATVYYRSPHQLVDGMGYNPVANFTETRRGV